MFGSLIYLAFSLNPRLTSLLLFCLTCRLMLSGDVELNPGPDKAKLDAIMKFFEHLTQTTREYQTDNASRLDRIEAGFSLIQPRVNSLECKVSELSKTTEDVSLLKSDLAFVKAELQSVTGQQKLVENLTAMVENSKNHFRTNNIIIKGIAEESTKTQEQLETTVRTFLSANINASLGVFERIHRLGPQRQDFYRPIIIKFLDSRDKMAMLKNTFKLKCLETKV